MKRIEVWPFQLDEREKAEVELDYGGRQMDKLRALFRALLPPDDTLYTAAEIVRRYFPGISKKKNPELYKIYVAHHKALNRLIRDSNYYAKPDNRDPITGELPRGKGKKSRQPCRWSRATWLLLLSDDVYDWLVELLQELTELSAAHPEGTRFFCDLQIFKFSFEEPPVVAIPDEDQAAAEKDQATGSEKQRGSDEEITEEKPQPDLPAPAAEEDQAIGSQTEDEEIAAEPRPTYARVMASVGLAAALILAFWIWPRSKTPGYSTYDAILTTAELELGTDFYIKANRDPAPYSTPRPFPGQWAAHWEPDQFKMMANAKPPSTLAGALAFSSYSSHRD